MLEKQVEINPVDIHFSVLNNQYMTMKHAIAPLLLLIGLAAGCQSKKSGQVTETGSADSTTGSLANVGNPKLLTTLPEKYNTPDGLALSPDGTVYLSMPNLANNSYPGVLLKFVGDSVQFVADLPAHPDTKHACPMDLAFGPDGNLYYADNQYENDKNYKSRLMRIRMKNGVPGVVEPVVAGFGLSNAVVWRGNTVYVTDSQWDMPGNDSGSAVFRFTIDELNKGTTIDLKPKTEDPHILAMFTTTINETGVDNGADGLDYDSKGNLYTGSYGDGTLYKLSLKPDGSLAKKEVVTVSSPISCIDGLIIDRTTDNIYLCESRINAIKTVTPTGQVSVLARNGDTDGTGGLLDQPAEILLKGKRLYVSDYDKPDKKFVNTRSDAPRTMSYIDLN